MNRQEASRLSIRIEREDNRVSTTLNRWQDGSYDVRCVDTRNGAPFTVNNPEEWADRKAESDLYRKAYGTEE